MAATLNTTPRTPLERELDSALHETLDEIDTLKAENAWLQGRLDAMTSAFGDAGVLGVLQRIAHDADLAPELRVKAAAAAAPYERPKLAIQAKANVVSLYDVLERARQRERVIEHQPALGSDQEGEALGPPDYPAA
jgi:hypothetical protein